MARSSLSRRLPVLLLLPCCRLRGQGTQRLARQSSPQPVFSLSCPGLLSVASDIFRSPLWPPCPVFLNCAYRYTRRKLPNASR